MKALHLVSPRCFERVDIPDPSQPATAKTASWSGAPGFLCAGVTSLSSPGKNVFKPTPMATGAPIHECVGEVVECGSDLFCPGDRVLSIPDGNQGLAEYFLAQASRTVALKKGMEDPGAA